MPYRIFGFLWLLVLSGCGQYGPLRLPTDAAPVATPFQGSEYESN